MYSFRMFLMTIAHLIAPTSQLMMMDSQHNHYMALRNNLHNRDGAQPISLSDPLVFAHYMIITQPKNGDYKADITAAKSVGIDAFAVNYGGWGADWNMLAVQLDRFYQDASAMDFKLFMSYDTMVMSDPKMMVDLSNTYKHHPSQLWVDDKLFLSSFQVNDPPFDWQKDVLDKIDAPVMFMPASINEDANVVARLNVGSGPMTWIHPAATVAREAEIDLSFSNKRADGNKPWMAGIAPWFFKRLSPELNWLHAQDMGMWLDRWMHLIQLRPNFIELVTWNDYGESTYIGPTTSFYDNKQVQADCYYGGLTHEAFLKMANIFIRAYKSGNTGSIAISPQEEDVFMYYRLQPVKTNGRLDAWDLPKNAADLKDNVNIISFLAQPSTVSLNSGGVTKQLNAPAGISNFTVPWTLGTQSLSMDRPLGSGKQLAKTGPAIVAQMDHYQGNVVAM